MMRVPVGPFAAARRRRMAIAAGLGAGAYLTYRLVRRIRQDDLRGKVVLVTGGSRGLGFLMARRFAAEGCRVAICARDPYELAEAKRRLESDGADVLAVICDLREPAQIRRMATEVTEAFGGVDILVNNAGIIQVGPLESMTDADFEEAMAVDFWPAYHATFALLENLKRRRGSIVNITSIGARVAVPHLLPYTAAKFALYGFSEGLRAELAKDGVTVTTVVPGLMRTGSPAHAAFKGQHEKEYGAFSLSAATPLTAMSAERAARRIVRGVKRGEALIVLTWQAKLIRMAHDLAPGRVTDVFGVVNRMLPKADRPTEAVPGMRLATPASPSPLTRPLDRAAARTNQYVGEEQPSEEHARKAGLRRGARL